MLADNLEVTGIQWHPGFYGAAEIEFILDKNNLEFQREYNLSKEPIRMDLLVIKKLADVRIKNELGHIFKQHNVIEYKSPEDGLTIDDFYKTIGYACLYKGLGEMVDQIPAEEVTISIFRESYPRVLFEKLKGMGLEIREYGAGIYHITGNQLLFDLQVVVTGQLDKNMHRTLRILSKNAQEDDVRGFIKEAMQMTEQGDKNNIEAVLQVSVAANQKLYEAIRRREGIMCNALFELMKEDIEKREQETLLNVIKNLMDSTNWTAEQAMSAMKIPAEDRKLYYEKFGYNQVKADNGSLV